MWEWYGSKRFLDRLHGVVHGELDLREVDDYGGPTCGAAAVETACTAITFQSATASARAGAVQPRYAQASRAVRIRGVVKDTGSLLRR